MKTAEKIKNNINELLKRISTTKPMTVLKLEFIPSVLNKKTISSKVEIAKNKKDHLHLEINVVSNLFTMLT